MYPTFAVQDYQNRSRRSSWLITTFLALSVILLMGIFASMSVAVGHADNFTDIFYTNSFRGAFDWIKKLDWVGMIVQCVISCFSLFGVALLVIRIMTSMLYLSAKGMWEEVHDLKSSGGESEKDFIGLFGMAKTWASGKSGTGLDAIIGAVLVLLPDVKKYSDFGEKSGGKFEEDINITQYMLKIALPTVMTVFFFAMGFNGTLFQALAVTVDWMGTMADKAVSVNYAGFTEDLINRTNGYQFAYKVEGTNTGKLKYQIAKDVYGRAVSQIDSPNPNQLSTMGKNIEEWLDGVLPTEPGGEAIEQSKQISEKVKAGLNEASTRDRYMPYLGYDIVTNYTAEMPGAVSFSLGADGALAGLGGDTDNSGIVAVDSERTHYLHLYVKQTTDFNGNYFNLDDPVG